MFLLFMLSCRWQDLRFAPIHIVHVVLLRALVPWCLCGNKDYSRKGSKMHVRGLMVIDGDWL